jgi:hypothetical protein
MESRHSENASLLQNDASTQPGQSQDLIALLPEDIQKYLLGFCALPEIVSLAQVNKKLHGLINDPNCKSTHEARGTFAESVEVIFGGTEIRAKTGYVTGSYAQLRDFFMARSRDQQRVADLDASCCITNSADDCNLIGTTFCGTFSTLSAAGAAVSTFLYLSLRPQDKLVALTVTGGFTGLCCLGAAGGAICLCTARHITNKNSERTAIQSQLIGAPKPESLPDGMLFSWKPDRKHAEHVPVKLGMHE